MYVQIGSKVKNKIYINIYILTVYQKNSFLINYKSVYQNKQRNESTNVIPNHNPNVLLLRSRAEDEKWILVHQCYNNNQLRPKMPQKYPPQ